MGFNRTRRLREMEKPILRFEQQVDDRRFAARIEAIEGYPEIRQAVMSNTLGELDLMRARIVARRRIRESDEQTLDRIDYLLGRLHYVRAVLCPTGTVDDEVDLATAVVLVAPHRVRPGEVPDGLVALVGTKTRLDVQAAVVTRLLNVVLADDRAVLLEASVVLLDDVATTLPADDPNRPIVLSNLGVALVNRFRRAGSPADLDRALALHRQAISLLSQDDPEYFVLRGNLASALKEIFHRDQRIADLDEAISELRAVTAGDHHELSVTLSNLCDDLRTRYEHSGQKADLTAAVSVGRQAVAATPPEHHNRCSATYFLALALCHHSGQGGPTAAVINQALALADEAVERGGPRHPNRQAHVELRDGLRKAANLAHKRDGAGR